MSTFHLRHYNLGLQIIIITKTFICNQIMNKDIIYMADIGRHLHLFNRMKKKKSGGIWS